MAVTAIRTEKMIQHAVKQFLAYARCTVYDTSQPRAAMVTPGLPDLLCFHPRRGFFVVEVKREGGKQSGAQREFEAHCKAAGVPYVLGGIDEVAAFLEIDIS